MNGRAITLLYFVPSVVTTDEKGIFVSSVGLTSDVYKVQIFDDRGIDVIPKYLYQLHLIQVFCQS